MTLKDRLEEVMAAMNWKRADLVRVSKQSSSVVSQWLGRGGAKEVKTIGKIEAATYLEQATGFNAMWIAKGIGPKRVDSRKQVSAEAVSRAIIRSEITKAGSAAAHGTSTESPMMQAAMVFARALLESDDVTRESVAPLLVRLAKAPEDYGRIARMIEALIQQSRDTSQPPSGPADDDRDENVRGVSIFDHMDSPSEHAPSKKTARGK